MDYVPTTHAPRTVSCGCCTDGCVCWNHRDEPRGLSVTTCAYHRGVGHISPGLARRAAEALAFEAIADLPHFGPRDFRVMWAAPQLLAALQPFARLWLEKWAGATDDTPVYGTNAVTITVGHIRAAAAVIEALGLVPEGTTDTLLNGEPATALPEPVEPREPSETTLDPYDVEAAAAIAAWNRRKPGDSNEEMRNRGPDLVDVVAAVRRDDAGRYWLCRRDSSGAHGGLAGMWEYPGGKVEPGEQLREALRRELNEEFGWVEPLIGPVLDSIVYGPYRVTFFEVRTDAAAELRKHTEARWMTAEEACQVEHLPSGTIFNARHLTGMPPVVAADQPGVVRADDRAAT